MNRFLPLAIIVLGLTSCATVLSHSTQEVAFLTPGAYDSVCIIDNGDTKYRVWPPQTITISKRSANLVVHCTADGNREKTVTLNPDTQAIAYANIFTGVGPGLFIDHESGALYAYPGTIVVDFSDMIALPMTRPNYDLFLDENPDLFKMEEFRPGTPALYADKYRTGTPLRKKESLSEGNFDEFTSYKESASEIPSPASDTVVDPEPAAPVVPDNGGIGGGASAAPLDPSTDMISDLTRRMNPQVFGGAKQGATQPRDSGFIGGTTAAPPEDDQADNGPVSLQPDGGQ